MIVKEYIKEFEAHGLGMFVHFGLYSVRGEGEWDYNRNNVPKEEYEATTKLFNPAPDWAVKLVEVAKSAGCKYITLTTRHHDGFSLYDTCGLNDYDAPHVCGRDLIREYVDACRAGGIVPFFYHTLLDWRHEDYDKDFKSYLVYLRKSVEILCKNYGKIGGLRFDGKWNKPDEDWQKTELYATIRKYQPEAMIINNTGLSALGKTGHPEIDSVTFERGTPTPMNREGAEKYIASEMCQIFGYHWGYSKCDYNYKSLASIIEDLCNCRRIGANFLMNIGPMGNGYARPIDAAMMATLGEWVAMNDEALRKPLPSGISVEGKEHDFVLRHEKDYYVFCFDIPSQAMTDTDPRAYEKYNFTETLEINQEVVSAIRLDNGMPLEFEQCDGKINITIKPYKYGEHPVVSIVKLTVK